MVLSLWFFIFTPASWGQIIFFVWGKKIGNIHGVVLKSARFRVCHFFNLVIFLQTRSITQKRKKEGERKGKNRERERVAANKQATVFFGEVRKKGPTRKMHSLHVQMAWTIQSQSQFANSISFHHFYSISTLYKSIHEILSNQFQSVSNPFPL